MPHYGKYTPEEDQRIMEVIASSPDNITECSEKLSNETGRTPKAILNRWYNIIKPMLKREGKEVFRTSSRMKVKINGKNKVRHSAPESVQSALNLLYDSLSKEQKEEFVRNKISVRL